MTLNPKLQHAIDRLTIADVILKAINAYLADDFDPDLFPSGDDLSLQTVFPTCKAILQFEGIGDDEGRRRTVFEMFAGLRVLRPAPKDLSELSSEEISELVCATIECHFLVKYDYTAVENGDGLDEESLSQFAQRNVPFNVWPYWREVVQSACGRMGLPKIVLPPHRLKKSP